MIFADFTDNGPALHRGCSKWHDVTYTPLFLPPPPGKMWLMQGCWRTDCSDRVWRNLWDEGKARDALCCVRTVKLVNKRVEIIWLQCCCFLFLHLSAFVWVCTRKPTGGASEQQADSTSVTQETEEEKTENCSLGSKSTSVVGEKCSPDLKLNHS